MGRNYDNESGGTFCIDCSLQAFLDHREQPVFDETPAQHIKRHHPEIGKMLGDRPELIERANAKMTELERRAAQEARDHQQPRVWVIIVASTNTVAMPRVFASKLAAEAAVTTMMDWVKNRHAVKDHYTVIDVPLEP